MNCVAAATSQELGLPFRVTNAFAYQRIFRCSFMALLNLKESLEVYIETFKDHDNREDYGYRLYGQNFVIDLLGLLDLLKPLAALMTQIQAQSCPGWKLTGYIPVVRNHTKQFIANLKSGCFSLVTSRFRKHMEDIKNFNYGKTVLVEGWLITEKGENGKPIKWDARDSDDCINDLKVLAKKC